ncbi:hypothetical protein FOZ63_010700, partial [Perkinsus olseni]
IARDPKNGYSDTATKASTTEVTEAVSGATAAGDAKVTTPQADTSDNNGSSSRWDKNWYTTSPKMLLFYCSCSWNETPKPDGNVLPQPVWDSPPTAMHDKEVQDGSAKVKSSEKGKKKKSKKKSKKSKDKEDGSSSSSGSSSS